MGSTVIGWRRWVRTDVLLCAVAICTGVSGAILGGRYLDARAASAEAAMNSRFQTRRVVVATSDLPRGTVVTPKNLAVRSIPREYVPPDFVSAERAGTLIGGRLAVDVGSGLPVSTSSITPASATALASVLAPNERALTLSVDELSSQAGGIRAGDFVDLYYAQRADGDALLIPLLQMTQILAVGDAFTTAQDGDRPRHFATVTLRVAVSDAPRILVAQQAGDISVLLRARGDAVLQEPRAFNSRELLRTKPTSAAASPGIELLTGGSGVEAPSRTWLRVGAGLQGGNS